jgi:hypothetical protein
MQVAAYVSERVRESILAVGEHRSDDMAQMTEREHRRILAAIEAQDETGAQQAMQTHLAGAAKRVGLLPEWERADAQPKGAAPVAAVAAKRTVGKRVAAVAVLPSHAAAGSILNLRTSRDVPAPRLKASRDITACRPSGP